MALSVRKRDWLFWFLSVQVFRLKCARLLVLVGVDIAYVKWGLIQRLLDPCLIAPGKGLFTSTDVVLDVLKRSFETIEVG
ncbi:hypothetical protein FCULG_00009612 [Fusarium culmorum]|uniref:Uncharacterized protein n=1 Tax=Fusarium culmorum TaxID=5516 RepID=A0A2T4GHF8_FUSCU|nr:hypothetical protein FCULG_00009612 [Fusarium culmorum]